jgi:RNA polymerase sigma-70 factor, ECF subfamily
MNQYSESELVFLLQGGEITAFNELYERNWKLLYRVAYRSVCSQDEAMDLVQNVFVTLWDTRTNLRADKSVSAYLFTILKNNIINFYRRQNLSKAAVEKLTPLKQEAPSTEEAFYAKELSLQINSEIALLPNKMQEIFILSRKEHRSVAEISAQLKISPRTVKNQLSNALRILRSRLNVIKSSQILKMLF